MLIRIAIQLIYTGILIGVFFYRKDNKIHTKSEPESIWFWVIQGILFPITFMWFALIEVLSKDEE